MIIKNKGIKLVDFFIRLRTDKEKTRGLMFKKKIKNIAYIFEYDKPQKLLIHMFFVFQYIDVCWLNQNKVIDIKRYVAPFTALVSHKGYADTFIEFPAGTLKHLEIGDTIEI